MAAKKFEELDITPNLEEDALLVYQEPGEDARSVPFGTLKKEVVFGVDVGEGELPHDGAPEIVGRSAYIFVNKPGGQIPEGTTLTFAGESIVAGTDYAIGADIDETWANFKTAILAKDMGDIEAVAVDGQPDQIRVQYKEPGASPADNSTAQSGSGNTFNTSFNFSNDEGNLSGGYGDRTDYYFGNGVDFAAAIPASPGTEGQVVYKLEPPTEFNPAALRVRRYVAGHWFSEDFNAYPAPR